MAIVAHRRFEMVCAGLVILCAAVIGIEADYEIRNSDEGQHPVFRGFDIAFNLWFATELALRWSSEGLCAFFSCENPSVRWNFMDFFLVLFAVLEEIAALMAAASFLEVSALRMLRMMRLVRVARVIRMLRFFSELRVMVNGIMGSTKPLLWAFVFLLILMFIVGVTFMQLASNYIKENGGSQQELIIYWGSLSRTMMTLYMAISGGIDWQDCVRPLRMVSEALEYMFATYVFFTMFCCLNIVTGIFVDNAKALKGADEDAMYLEALTERKRWIADIKDLFMRLATLNGHFTLDDFKEQIYNIKVQTLFRKLGINLDGINAEELWDILDADQSGCIDEEEFAKGLKFFQGPAQSIHVYRLMREGAKLHDKVEHLAEVCSEILEHQRLQMQD
ncbi:scn4aa [Symbiodinium pilosum]|uniref:Scn4aa protein n=1 Tax=Symbiodinium pilosum TaxID=2952 RepID=A0A812YC92_SYMPI|nr:scn4aa [Symbiodinium pilosum]